MTTRTIKLIAALGTLLGVPLLLLGVSLMTFLGEAVTPAQRQVIQIRPGMSLTQVAQQLEAAGVVADAQRFVLLARWRDASARIQAGEYEFSQPAPPGAILTRLETGDVRLLRLTIPEGLRLEEIARRVADLGICTTEQFLALATDPEQAALLGVAADTLEGYLFPETYLVSAGTAADELIRLMVAQFDRQIDEQLLATAHELGLTRHQLVTLASIIQKEAGTVAEMPLISAVFHNRLQRGIPLQADPTVIYGIADFNGNLTRKHLRTPTPYNTYTRRGLPPGPIASPGREALQAAAHPTRVNYLYFVARGNGTHEFSATLAEHNRAVQRYQLRR